ncbi:RNA-directed DNA polymerase, eukaryota [Tanacetum coccineum]
MGTRRSKEDDWTEVTRKNRGYRTKEDDLVKVHSNADLTRTISKSIFVTNFPDNTTSADLWNICQTYGVVVDVYIPNRRSKNALHLQMLFRFERTPFSASPQPPLPTGRPEESEKESILTAGSLNIFLVIKQPILNEVVVQTSNLLFPKENSYDPFNIYDILNKENKDVNAAATNSSIPFPPGFTPDKPDTDVDELVAQKDQFIPRWLKSVECSSHTVESESAPNQCWMINSSSGSIEKKTLQKKKEVVLSRDFGRDDIGMVQCHGFLDGRRQRLKKSLGHGDLRAFWWVILILMLFVSQSLAVKGVMIDGEWVDDPSKVKDEFRDYFASLGPVWDVVENKSPGRPDGFTFDFLSANSGISLVPDLLLSLCEWFFSSRLFLVGLVILLLLLSFRKHSNPISVGIRLTLVQCGLFPICFYAEECSFIAKNGLVVRDVRGGEDIEKNLHSLSRISGFFLIQWVLSNMGDRRFWDLNGDGCFRVKDVHRLC